MTETTTERSVTPSARILLCADRTAPFDDLFAISDEPDVEIDTASTPQAAVEKLALRSWDVCIVDVTWTDADVALLHAALQSASAATHVLRLSETSEVVAATESGTIEFVPLSAERPLAKKILRFSAERARLQSENRSLKRQLQVRVLNEIVGQSPAAQELRDAIRSAAELDGGLLVQGEPGTGSQQVVRVVHLAGRRALRPFLVLDCRVHSAESMERELLGDQTDPSRSIDQGLGRLATCAGGTLLLKNVETLPIATQKKLAGIVTRNTFTCAASGSPRRLDVRLAASTHADLAALAQEGRFHVGLYESLTACSIRIPSLRERMQDIGLLTEQVLEHLAAVEGKPVKRLSVEALKLLRAHDWPGNRRELENVIERACSLDEGTLLTADMLRPWLARNPDAEAQERSGLSLREMERKLIETTFARCHGNREQTARLLKIGIRTLSGKLREYGYPPRGGPGSNRRLSKAA